MKFSKKWLIIIIIVLLIAGYFAVKAAFKNPSDGFIYEKAGRGQVTQEVSETGSVKAAKEVALGFKISGKVSSVNVSVGDRVQKGTPLAALDASQLSAQLQSAKAALASAKTEYEKLLNGLTKEDIRIYQDAVDSANQNLRAEYAKSLNTLNDAYIKIYNAYTASVSIANAYFSSSDQEGIKFFQGRNDINKNMQSVKNYLDVATANPSDANIDLAATQMLLSLDNVHNSLGVMRDQCDIGIYFSKVSSADKTSLDTQKSNINTARANVTTAQQNINSYKLAVRTAESNLASKTATARQEDIEISKAKIERAQADVLALQTQLDDNYLRSPIDGIITQVNAKRGQVAAVSQNVVNLLSTEPFQIKVDIYEQDIVNVKIGDSVKINLVAFPKQIFEGKVISIDPGEKIVDNVVYYEVTVDFPNQPQQTRSGMTADIVILTEKKENVLRVPKSAVYSIDGKYKVQMLKNKKVEEREISVGLEGNDYFEVVSGLSEGDQVITGKK